MMDMMMSREDEEAVDDRYGGRGRKMASRDAGCSKVGQNWVELKVVAVYKDEHSRKWSVV